MDTRMKMTTKARKDQESPRRPQRSQRKRRGNWSDRARMVWLSSLLTTDLFGKILEQTFATNLRELTRMETRAKKTSFASLRGFVSIFSNSQFVLFVAKEIFSSSPQGFSTSPRPWRTSSSHTWHGSYKPTGP